MQHPHFPKLPTKKNSLTSPIHTPLHRDNRIPLQPPRTRPRRLTPNKRSITRAHILYIKIVRRFLRLDGTTNGESVGGGFGPEDRDRSVVRVGLEVEVVDWVAYAADFANGWGDSCCGKGR
jgi:hypothetical protein